MKLTPITTSNIHSITKWVDNIVPLIICNMQMCIIHHNLAKLVYDADFCDR